MTHSIFTFAIALWTIVGLAIPQFSHPEDILDRDMNSDSINERVIAADTNLYSFISAVPQESEHESTDGSLIKVEYLNEVNFTHYDVTLLRSNLRFSSPSSRAHSGRSSGLSPPTII